MPDLPAIQHDVPLGGLNTLGLAARAERFATIQSPEELVALWHSKEWGGGPALVLGGGSNLVLTGDVSGLVVHIAIRKFDIRDTEDAVLIACGIVMQHWWLIPAAVVQGYAFSWIGHFVFENNRPATFKHPLWSVIGDFRMLWEILSGRIAW